MKKTIIIVMIIGIVGFVCWYAFFQKSSVISSGILLKEQGVLTVGLDVPYEPMEFFDAKGNIVGIDADIAKEIAKKLKVKLVLKDINWDDLFPAVKNGDVDLALSAITITPERSKEMLFSNPYFDGGQVIIARKSDVSNIHTLSDLIGKKVGAQPETTSYTETAKVVGESSMVPYASFDSTDTSGITYDLVQGTIDAVITDYLAATGLTKDNTSLTIVGEPFTMEFYGIATKLGNQELITEVNDVINDMKSSGKLKEIKTAWINNK
jgi:ABC-type amino acid transport substrate-binding protein